MIKRPNTENITAERIPSDNLAAAEEENIGTERPTHSSTQWAIFVYVVVILLWVWRNQFFFRQQLSTKTQTLHQFLIDAFQDLPKQQAQKYIGIEELGGFSELPICIVADNSKWSSNTKFPESLSSQHYKNYKTALVNLHQSKTPGDRNDNYFALQKTLQKQCDEKSVLFFMDRPLAQKGLQNLNNYYQTYNAWMTYSIFQDDKDKDKSSANGIQLVSVYKRVFDFLNINDFFNFNKKILLEPTNSDFIMTGLFQLCKFFTLSIPSNQVFGNVSELKESFFYSSLKQRSTEGQQIYRRRPYQTLHSLAQNYRLKESLSLNEKRNSFMESNSTITQKIGIFSRSSMISHIDMKIALQFEQTIYLPQSHSLNLLEIKMMQQKFETGKYMNKELPLCININSHNNIQNERYKKVLDSVTAQNYTNYQIVFIDDMSDDETMTATQKYLKEVLKFPRERVSYIKNKVHTYATYNIINAAFNYCANDSIQVLVDGDDQLIGKQIFKLINAEYQKNNLWVMYTFYKSDKYDEGISIPFKSQYLRGFFGGRKLIHYFGPTRTFKVSLVRKLPLREHLNERGQFLDTMYDTALEYPLFEMSGGKHSKYVNYTSYLYFSGYGGNDDSNIFKVIRRIGLNIYVSLRDPLAQLEELDDHTQDEEVSMILKEGKGKIYEQLD